MRDRGGAPVSAARPARRDGGDQLRAPLRVSVIVPALDEAAGIAEALRGVRGAHEVIVADGGSRDATARIAEACGARVVTAPRGRALQMNAAARQAGGDVLLFLHADTRLPADGLARIAAAVEAGAAWGRFDVALEPSRRSLALVAAAINLRSRLTGICTGDQAIFVARPLWQRCGGFAPIPLMEDIDLSARLRRMAPPAALRARASTSARRWLARGVARTVIEMWAYRAAWFLGASAWALHRRYYGVRAPAVRGTVIVFARAPIEGRVKTRLAAQVGPRAALEAYVALARLAIEAAAGVADARRVLCVDGDPRDATLRAWACHADARLVAQGDGDLGLRMRRALARATADGLPAVLIGSDCPEVDAALIGQALDALHGRDGAPPADAVFAPAADGGYALVGVRRDLPTLFEGIAWGGARVMADTRARCAAAGLRWRELRTVHDVDDAEGLARWQGAARARHRRAPREAGNAAPLRAL